MHNFDTDHKKTHNARLKDAGDRQFTLRGRTLRWWPNASYTAIKAVAALSEDTSGSNVFDVFETAVLALIDPDDHELFREAVRDAKFPVTFEDLADIANWLIGQQVGRPPTPPESSATGSTLIGGNGTEVSSSEQGALLKT